MKFTVSVPQEILDGMDERAAAAEISRSELVRRAILAYNNPAGQASGASEDLAALTAERDRLTELLAERDQEAAVLVEEVERETAEADRIRERLTTTLRDSGRYEAEANQLRADLSLAQKTVARAEDEVAWLRKLTERLATPDNTEK